MFVNVRLLRPWNGHQPGRVFCDMPVSSAELLVRRDVAEVIPPGADPPKAAAATERDPKKPRKS